MFGRDPYYDTARDSIVRVAANDISKRLVDYYLREGKSASVKIVLPSGSYVPVFHKTEPVAGEPASAVDPVAEPVPPPAATARLQFSWRPVAILLWTQIFGNDRPACVVPSDANLTMFEEMIGRNVTIQEYAQKRFREIIESERKDPATQAIAELLMRPPSTSMADAATTRAFGEMNTKHRIPTDLIFDREFGTGYFDSHNVVLLGSLRANPWVIQSGSSERAGRDRV